MTDALKRARVQIARICHGNHTEDMLRCPNCDPTHAALDAAVEEARLRYTTPAMFALEELSRWPKAAEGNFVMWSPFVEGKDGRPESKPHAVPPEKVEGIFEALLERMNEIAPEARKAMQAYYDIDGVRCALREATEALAAKQEKYEEALDAWKADLKAEGDQRVAGERERGRREALDLLHAPDACPGCAHVLALLQSPPAQEEPFPCPGCGLSSSVPALDCVSKHLHRKARA